MINSLPLHILTECDVIKLVQLSCCGNSVARPHVTAAAAVYCCS